MKRFFANLIVIMAIAFLPWWCPVILLVLLAFLFDFWEIALYGLVLDILYSIPGGFFLSHLFLLSGLILYALIAFIRPNLRNV